MSGKATQRPEGLGKRLLDGIACVLIRGAVDRNLPWREIVGVDFSDAASSSPPRVTGWCSDSTGERAWSSS